MPRYVIPIEVEIEVEDEETALEEANVIADEADRGDLWYLMSERLMSAPKNIKVFKAILKNGR
jgi:hypothetical protein